MYLERIFSEEKKRIIINFFLALIPLTLILGNLTINLNILIIIFLSGIFYFNRINFDNLSYVEKATIAFFSFILLTGLWNQIIIYTTENDFNDYHVIITKSFFLLRFLVLIFIVKFLVEEKLFNFKWFFLSSLFCVTFVCIDIIYQFYFSKDIFGIAPMHPRKLSGPFGDELIAGGYIQRFSIFAFFSLSLFLKIRKPYLSLAFTALFLLTFISIILSGNRMPLILFALLIFLVLIFEKAVRKYIFPIFLITSIIFGSTYYFNKQVKINFDHFTRSTGKMINVFMTDIGKKEKIFKEADIPLYYQEFRSFYETWKMNKFIGGGVKSFRENCKRREIKNDYERVECNTHPHNYYLEIMSEIGLIGFFLVIFMFFSVVRSSFKQNYQGGAYSNKVFIAILFVFIAEIIPVRSSGSFFTTGNATFIFLMYAILLGSIKKILK